MPLLDIVDTLGLVELVSFGIKVAEDWKGGKKRGHTSHFGERHRQIACKFKWSMMIHINYPPIHSSKCTY